MFGIGDGGGERTLKAQLADVDRALAGARMRRGTIYRFVN